MANPTSASVPNQVITPNVPNTGTGVVLVAANPQRNGLLIWNISANTIWFGPPSIVFVSGTQQQGTFALLTGQWLYLGGLNTLGPVDVPFPPVFNWTWTQGLNAQAAAGATNAVTVLEF